MAPGPVGPAFLPAVPLGVLSILYAWLIPWLPLIYAGALAGLALFDPRAAGWLVPIALLPAAQYHYAVFALPVLSAPWLALIAVPLPGAQGLVVTGYAIARIWRRRRGTLPSPSASGGDDRA